MTRYLPDLTPGERAVLRAIRENPSCQQSLLTSRLDITQQSISRIIRNLVERRLLIVGPPVPQGRRGKPSPTLALKNDAVHALGISITADSVATKLIDFTGASLGREMQAISGMKFVDVLCTIDLQLGRLLALRGLDRSDVVGAGVAMTGNLMGQDRLFNLPKEISHWMDVDVALEIGRILRLPTWAENDGNAAAIGEAALGVGRRYKSFAYLYFSAEFGGGVIIDGKLLSGRFGNSGDLAGILPVNTHPQPNLESLRQVVSSHGVKLDSVHELVTKFDPAWPGVEVWIAKVKDSLNLVASACSAILDTEAIVLGGLMPPALADRIIPEIEFYSALRWGAQRAAPDVVIARGPPDATLLGAASMPLEHLYF